MMKAKKTPVYRACCVLIIMAVCFLMTSRTIKTVSLHEPSPLQRDVDDVIETRYFTLSKTAINPVADTLLIPGENICDAKKKSVVVLIASLPKDIGVRDILRRTWVNALKSNTWPHEKMDFEFKVVFLFGRGYTQEENDLLKTENNVYGDIVRGNFLDNYRNLTRKILFGLKWVTKYCSEARYVIKVDMDTFVHVPKLLRKIRVYDDDSSAGKIFCRLFENSVPKQDDNVYTNMYPLQFYPPYCAGPVYVISGKAVGRLVYASERMPYLPLEDVFVTGIIAKMAVVNRINVLPNLKFRNTPESECSFQSSSDDDPIHVADSGYRPSQIKRIWKCLNQGPDLKDYIKLIYNYNLLRHIDIHSLPVVAAFAIVLILMIVLKCGIH